MKSESLESRFYILVIVLVSIGAFVWMALQQPSLQSISKENEMIIMISAAAAIFLELASPSLPCFGNVSSASAFYLFMILLGAVPIACVVAFIGTSFRVIARERGPILLRIFSPFQRLLSVEIASLVLLIPVAKESPAVGDWILTATAPVYFIFDALFEGTGVGFTLSEEEQKHWFKSRYQSLALSLALPLLGVFSFFLYRMHARSPLPFYIVLTLIILLQFAMFSTLQRETSEVTTPILEDLENARSELRTAQRHYEEMRKQVAQKTFELGLLLDFGRGIGSNLTLDYAFEVLIDIFKKLFHYQSCIIFFSDTNRNETVLRPKRYMTPYKELCKNLHIRFGETIVGLCAREKRGFITDPRKQRNFSLLIENERSEMAVPLIVEDRVKGVIYVGNPEEGTYSGAELQLMTTIAYQAAIVLVYAESYEYTVALATTDGLTSLFTHRYFQERLMEEVKRSERYHQPLSLMMIDLDHFKEYNDTYGHVVGDQLLKKASQILKDCTRGSDIVCRYGGDEFAILLLETTKETTLLIAKRIREAMELRVNSDPSTNQVKITTSIGVASFPEDASNKSDLLKEADKALYESKNSGRNRVVAARRFAH